jgi:hypothetical protein
MQVEPVGRPSIPVSNGDTKSRIMFRFTFEFTNIFLIHSPLTALYLIRLNGHFSVASAGDDFAALESKQAGENTLIVL